MFTVICSNPSYPESLKSAALEYKKEWGFGFAYSDRNEHEENTVMKDVGLL